jgi:hypothetical protein
MLKVFYSSRTPENDVEIAFSPSLITQPSSPCTASCIRAKLWWSSLQSLAVVGVVPFLP